MAGAVTADAAEAALGARLGSWKLAPARAEISPPAVAHSGSPYYLVDMPGSAQTGFYLVFPG